jgi:hypothetical protein
MKPRLTVPLEVCIGMCGDWRVGWVGFYVMFIDVIGSGGNFISASKVVQGISETGFADANGNSCVEITYQFF